MRAQLTTTACAIVAVLAGCFACLQASAQNLATLPDTTITGEVQVVQEDTFKGDGGKLYHVITDKKTGTSYWLEFKAKPKRPLKSGQVIKVRGKIRGDEFVVNSGDSATVNVVQDSPATTGLRTIAVIIVNFLDTPVPATAQTVSSIMWPDPAQNNANPNVSDLYQEASGDLVGFERDTDGNGSPDVFGPYTVNAYSADACDYYSWAYQAEDMAAADGVQLGQYQHLLFVLPTSNTCAWIGVANVGCGTQCRAWVVGTNYKDAYAHELGHNLSMRHASSDTNNDGITDNAYGDLSDIMGYSGVGYRHPNAAHKEQMGWFSGYSGRVQTVQQGGTYTIAPLELFPWETNLPQMLKVYKPDTSSYYYLSYRTRLGYDSALNSSYVEKLNIHRYAGSGSIETYFVRALADGQAFEDTKNGVKVTQTSHNADPVSGSVTVQITLSGSVLAPTVTISPTNQTANKMGMAAQYGVSVKNNDVNTGASTFGLAAILPSGWTATAQPAQLTLSPGQSGSFTVTVQPPATLADNNYTLKLGASDVSGAHADITSAVTYKLDTTPPASVTGLSASLNRKGQVVLAWTASSDGAGTGVAQYDVYRASGSSAAAFLASVTTTQYTNTSVTAGTTYTYYVVAVDKVGNKAAPSGTVAVTTPAKTTRKR
ncbi:MAG: hypothetical protein IT364_24715 [Candidatus Hydrogenedentes bacterium]|nr:hypothetical protein [Candidatus Hydrogenedentota bacterium]